MAGKLAAYSLAAGAAAFASQGVQADIVHYEAPAPGYWEGTSPHALAGGFPWYASYVYPLLLFQLDGTVMTVDQGPAGAPPKSDAETTAFWNQVAGGDAIYFTHEVIPVGGKWGDALCANATGDVPAGTVADGFDSTKYGFCDTDVDGSLTYTSWEPLYVYDDYFSVWGPWGWGGRGYLGFYIDEGLGPHYGWADIWVGNARNELKLYSFAYETTVGEPIHVGDVGGTVVPEPLTLSLLAAGATGLLALRRRK